MQIEIFSDETYIEDDYGNNYLGIGCLFIPISNKKNLLNDLLNLRCLNPNSDSWTWDYEKCLNECKEFHHKMNNTEIHFKDIEKGMSDFKFKIYKNWINFLINHNKKQDSEENYIYFNILYIDLNKLDFDRFGVDKDTTNIYNRFFRTVILYAANTFFKDENLVIKNIYHDIADEKEKHAYFSWHIFKKLEDMENISFENNEIIFINSKHNSYDDLELKENTQFIQLIDLILGCSNQILFRKSKDINKIKIASEFYILFERLWKYPFNHNSSFKYFRSQRISMFPKYQIEKDKILNSLDNRRQFHNDLIIWHPDDINQSSLDEWF